MKSDIQRINNIIGQLEGIKKMIENEKDCFEVIVQVKAVKSAMHSFASHYISEQLLGCINSCRKDEQKNTCKKLIKEIIN
ncbi:metal-sensitive transcriptional regulator [Candidatus Parcubacteria bacterium]|nr:MAG: metal-sensitive transcriptional regulator [Candidatus Parcubacteria bacterium]